MGKTIAQKIFAAHMVEQPFEGTNIWTVYSATK